MSTSEVKSAIVAGPDNLDSSMKPSKAELAKKYFIHRGIWEDVEKFAKEILPNLEPEIITGNLEYGDQVATVVILWAPLGRRKKGIRISPAEGGNHKVEFTPSMRSDGMSGSWKELDLPDKEAKLPIRELLTRARANASGRVSAQRIFWY